MKQVLGTFVWIVIGLGIAFWVYSSKTDEGERKIAKDELETEKRAMTTTLITKMAAKHDAVTNWRQALDNEERIAIDFKSSA